MGAGGRERLRHVFVAGQHQHLPVGRQLCDKLDEYAGRRAGPGVVKVDQRIVHHHRQADVVPAEIADQRQPQGEKHLLAGAPAEPLRIPEIAVGVVDLEPSLIDGGRDRRVAALGEPGEPARGFAKHRGLMIAGYRGPRLLEQHMRPMEQVAPPLLLAEPLLDRGEFRLQAFERVVVGGRGHAIGHHLPPLGGGGERSAVPLCHLAGLGEPLCQGHQVGLGQPAVDFRRLGRSPPGFRPGELRHRGGRAGLLVLRPAVDLGEELLLRLHAPADEKLLHGTLGHVDLPQHAAMPAAGRLQSPRELAAAADRRPLRIEPLLEQLEVVAGHRLGHEFALHEHLVDPPREGGEFVALVAGLLGETLAVVVEREQRVAVGGDLPHLAGRERGGQTTRRERLSPAAAGCRAGLERVGERLLDKRDLVGQHVHRSLAGEQFLEPVDFGLGQRQPAVERERGIGRDRAVERAALLDEFIPLLLRHLELVPQGFESDGRVLVEGPGRDRRHARAREPECRHRVGHRAGDLSRQEQPREQHADAKREQRAQSDQPGGRHELVAHALGHRAVDLGDRTVELRELVAGGDPLADGGGAARGLLDRLGDREPCEAGASALHAPLGVVERSLGFGEHPLRLGHLAGGAGTVAGAGLEGAERKGEAFREQHLGDRAAVGVEVRHDRHHP